MNFRSVVISSAAEVPAAPAGEVSEGVKVPGRSCGAAGSFATWNEMVPLGACDAALQSKSKLMWPRVT